ncbi:MAG: ACP S-malonyltransferase [Bacillota bacterium]
MKKAILFPGQGAQYPGMGKPFYESSQPFKAVVDEANAVLPYDLLEIMFESEAVHETRYAQPALYVMGCALYDALRIEGVTFDMAAGLSIGEYPALYARGVFDFRTGLEIVEKRAMAMQKASEESDAAMVALKTGINTAQALISGVDDVYIANHNLEDQVVLAGSKKAIEMVQSKGKASGVRRMIPLKTSGAFHTPFMEKARESFEEYLKTVPFNEPEKGLYLNVTGKAYKDRLKKHMVDQMTGTVQFYPMLRAMLEDGLALTIEAGPKKTLSTFVKKTDKSVDVLASDQEGSIESILENLRSERHE